MRHTVVMVTTSYPRFPGDSVGTFMEPIAKSVAARGHEVHVVAPWHPRITRAAEEDGVRFHFFRYAPIPALNVFGYAAAMRADVTLRGAAYLAAPLALAAGWRAARQVASRHHATIMHGHWVVPGGVLAAAAAPSLPLVISLHGSDVHVAETLLPARHAARYAFRRAGAITACSGDLASRAVALGADASRVEVVPYGVDTSRFRPAPDARAAGRERLGVAAGIPLAFAAGRLVRKKGFEYLIDAVACVPPSQPLVLALAGDGDLGGELRARARAAAVHERVRFLGDVSQDAIAALMAAADVIVVPSIRDDSGNVDGLPNVVLEALASGTPLVTTPAGGIGAVVEHDRTALVVPERDARALARAIVDLVRDAPRAVRLGTAARELADARFGWGGTAARLEAAYERALAFKSSDR
jgi:glycosyltransferase involved in cell wall biosynthesis